MKIADVLFKGMIVTATSSLTPSAVYGLRASYVRRMDFLLNVLYLTNPPPTGGGDVIIRRDFKSALALQKDIRDRAVASDQPDMQQLGVILNAWLSPLLQGTGPSDLAAKAKRDKFAAALASRYQKAAASLNYIAAQNVWSWSKTNPPDPEPALTFAD